MTDSPKTPEDVLALPEMEGFSMLSLKCDERGEAHYRGRAIKGPGPGMMVSIPVAPPGLVSQWVSDHYPIMVRDADGEYWRAVLTESGWRRMRA
jgi:hypothetical protein